MILLLVSVLAELLVFFVTPLWRVRKGLALANILIIGVWSLLLAGFADSPLIAAILAINLFRVINMARLIKGRMHDYYLRHVCTRTGLTLLFLTVLAILLAAYGPRHAYATLWMAAAAAQLCVALILVGSTVRRILKTKSPAPSQFYSDKELPTITVAIPARNETQDMAACLESILANNYPKLEVLVLDDCSQDKTSEIIKGFAQRGVRFVQGEEPRERWLAKNQAYDKLVDEANGDYVLFCGVDVRFGPDSLRAIMTAILNRKKSMLSILPIRSLGGPKVGVIQPMRYWWELALPRRMFNKPPVLSTCWMVKREALERLGGFEAVSHAIIPEGYFARELVKKDLYAFVRASEVLNVRTVKSASEQIATAVRVRYPQLRRRLENVLLLLVLESVFLLGPITTVLLGVLLGNTTLWLLGAGALLLLLTTHVLIVTVTQPANTLFAVVAYPFIVLADMAIAIISMYRYEFGEVVWKGRNVCIPVMHVIPKLPALDQ